ncbi:MAG: hypothetical protein ACSHX0_06900 [Akkermansiaceae bacterium]
MLPFCAGLGMLHAEGCFQGADLVFSDTARGSDRLSAEFVNEESAKKTMSSQLDEMRSLRVGGGDGADSGYIGEDSLTE